ncbi:DUF167 domain-containing protein [Candidatus Kaiserbacteria bacterium]|nr:DUF167 domain-containing protein [Candidatus Kaiserbacteria bacterium]
MYIRVTVIPSAKKEKVTKLSDTRFEMQVKEPAERNLANRRVRTLLADTLGMPEGKVQMVTGHRSPIKMFDIDVN